MPLLASQPIKGMYALTALAIESIRLPIWAMLYVFNYGRPYVHWTFRQALAVRVIRAFLYHAAKVQMHVPLSLKPGGERERFVVMAPAHSSLYTGPMLLHPDVVQPEKIGGTWYPRLPYALDLKDSDVVLHFHGGAFILGDGRRSDCGYLASTLINHGKMPFVFCPQYRLSGAPSNCPFPAALQDALTAYMHLVKERGVSPNRVILSGDSAGANLALAFLRYIETYGNLLGIPKPGAIFLWSTWVDVLGSLDEKAAERSPHSSTDYVSGAFGYWGASKYVPDALKAAFSAADLAEGKAGEAVRYISHVGNAFKTDVPMFMAWGEREMLFHDDLKLAEEMRAAGNMVETYVQRSACHDILLIGNLLGMEDQASDSAAAAGQWVRKVRNL